MIAGMKWLVAGAQPGDSLFMHYSGHGGQTEDESGDEEDVRQRAVDLRM